MTRRGRRGERRRGKIDRREGAAQRGRVAAEWTRYVGHLLVGTETGRCDAIQTRARGSDVTSQPRLIWDTPPFGQPYRFAKPWITKSSNSAEQRSSGRTLSYHPTTQGLRRSCCAIMLRFCYPCIKTAASPLCFPGAPTRLYPPRLPAIHCLRASFIHIWPLSCSNSGVFSASYIRRPSIFVDRLILL